MVKNLEITVRTRTEMKMWLNIKSGLIKGLLLGLRQFVMAESPLKMMIGVVWSPQPQLLDVVWCSAVVVVVAVEL